MMVKSYVSLIAVYIIVGCGTNFAQAQNTSATQNCFVPSEFIARNLSVRRVGSVSCEQQASILQEINRVERRFVTSAGLSLPAGIEIGIFSDSTGSSFDGYHLDLPIRNSVYDHNFEKHFKSEIESDPVRLHEFGHAVFESSLSRDSNVLKYVFGLNRQRSAVQPGQAIYETTQREFALRVRSKYSAILPYHELFADSFAVIYKSQGGQIMAEAAIFKGLNDHKNKAMFPSFEIPIFAEEWNVSEPHLFFNPVRFFIWKNLINGKVSTSISKPEKIRILYDALLPIVSRIAADGPALATQNIPLQNAEVIEAISRELAKLKK